MTKREWQSLRRRREAAASSGTITINARQADEHLRRAAAIAEQVRIERLNIAMVRRGEARRPVAGGGRPAK